MEWDDEAGRRGLQNVAGRAAGVTIQRDLGGVRMALEAQFELNIEGGNMKGGCMVLREREFEVRAGPSVDELDIRREEEEERRRKTTADRDDEGGEGRKIHVMRREKIWRVAGDESKRWVKEGRDEYAIHRKRMVTERIIDQLGDVVEW